MRDDELMHFGVLGMKWGIRRYQPYSVKPRGSGKGGKEIGEAKTQNKSDKRINLTDRQKKALRTGATIAGGVLAAYGFYKLGRELKLDNIARKSASNEIVKNARDKAKVLAKDFEGTFREDKYKEYLKEYLVNDYKKNYKGNITSFKKRYGKEYRDYPKKMAKHVFNKKFNSYYELFGPQKPPRNPLPSVDEGRIAVQKLKRLNFMKMTMEDLNNIGLKP